MSVVNFAISKPLELKVKKIIKQEGFASKAEFFRFAAMQYIKDFFENDISQEELDEDALSLSETLVKVSKKKKFPSVREQMADLK